MAWHTRPNAVYIFPTFSAPASRNTAHVSFSLTGKRLVISHITYPVLRLRCTNNKRTQRVVLLL